MKFGRLGLGEALKSATDRARLMSERDILKYTLAQCGKECYLRAIEEALAGWA